jgi:hypothetical protein
MNEKQLMGILKQTIYPDLDQSESATSTFDCISFINLEMIELKSRRTHYDDLVIEKMKYDSLLEKSYKIGMNPIYICSTPSGIWRFKVSALPEPTWETKSMPKTTDFNNKNWVQKVVGFIHIKEGEDITYIIEKANTKSFR